MNNFPLMSFENLPHQLEFIPAILLGFLFGFVLERSGFGSAKVLVAQFYLSNMRVFKVMFSAIITALAGFGLLVGLGALSLADIAVPETFLWPMLVGGLLLGVGFIVSGFCPGTSVVAAASGKWDGLVTVVGVAVGSVLFAEVYPSIESFYLSSPQGVFLLSDLFGIPFPVLALAIPVMAVGMFFGAEKVEAIFAPKAGEEKERSITKGAGFALGGVLAAGALGIVMLVAGSPMTPAAPDKPMGLVEPLPLAERLVEDPTAVMVVDVRSKPSCEGPQVLPGAVCLEDIAADLGAMYAGKTLVAYADEFDMPQDATQALKAFKGEVVWLAGGYAGWKATLLEEPKADSPLTTEQKATAATLRAHFTGTAAAAPAPAAGGAKPKVQRKPKKGGGCS